LYVLALSLKIFLYIFLPSLGTTGTTIYPRTILSYIDFISTCLLTEYKPNTYEIELSDDLSLAYTVEQNFTPIYLPRSSDVPQTIRDILTLYKAYTKKDKQLTICVIIERTIVDNTCQLSKESGSPKKKEAKLKPKAKKQPPVQQPNAIPEPKAQPKIKQESQVKPMLAGTLRKKRSFSVALKEELKEEPKEEPKIKEEDKDTNILSTPLKERDGVAYHTRKRHAI
jgi:hypothetical protein